MELSGKRTKYTERIYSGERVKMCQRPLGKLMPEFAISNNSLSVMK